MRTLILFLLVAPLARATVFELKDSAQRFRLAVTAQGVEYRSEAVSKRLSTKPCNKELLRLFYSSWLRKLPKVQAPKGRTFLIDQKPTTVDPRHFLTLDAEVLALALSEGKACP